MSRGSPGCDGQEEKGESLLTAVTGDGGTIMQSGSSPLVSPGVEVDTLSSVLDA